jgi:hypothetical protein
VVSATNLRLFSDGPLFSVPVVLRRHGLTNQLMAAALDDDWSLADISVAEQCQVDVSELRGLDAGKSFLRINSSVVALIYVQ